MSLKVRTTLMSAFGHKVIVSARILGVSDQLEILETQFRDQNDPIRAENPLGKMPVLTTEQGEHIYDSRVIVEYMNDRFNGSLIPSDPKEKIRIRTIEALSDGIIDAGVAIVIEGMFREGNTKPDAWLAHQYGKMDRGFDKLLQLDLNPMDKNIATVSVGCLLRWLKKREVYDLKEKLSYFDQWLERFETSLP